MAAGVLPSTAMSNSLGSGIESEGSAMSGAHAIVQPSLEIGPGQYHSFGASGRPPSSMPGDDGATGENPVEDGSMDVNVEGLFVKPESETETMEDWYFFQFFNCSLHIFSKKFSCIF